MFKRLFLAILWGFVGVFLIQFSASADPYAVTFCTKVVDGVGGSICQVNSLSDAISGIVSSMTTVAITPMGLGAAMKTFRHVVLMNV